jgi:hypothetical protein
LSEITKLLLKKTLNFDQNDYQQFSLITSFFFLRLANKHTKNKSWQRCRLYFRGRMQCWWIFGFETDYTWSLLIINEKGLSHCSWRWKPHKFWMCRKLATLDKLVDRFPLSPVSPPIGDTSLTHVMRLAAHSTTPPTPTAMGQSFIMTLYLHVRSISLFSLEQFMSRKHRFQLSKFPEY